MLKLPVPTLFSHVQQHLSQLNQYHLYHSQSQRIPIRLMSVVAIITNSTLSDTPLLIVLLMVTYLVDKR